MRMLSKNLVFLRQICPRLTLTKFIHANGFENTKHQSTVDDDEVTMFNELSKEFWDINGPFQALHTMNRVRVPIIRDAVVQQKNLGSKPLESKTILDIGCGGGILSEPLARLGAKVTGIDASEEVIKVARNHAKHDPEVKENVNYECTSVEDLVDQSFDVVVASEVIEHVADQVMFVKKCSQLTKLGGALIITTINRTPLSYLLAIFGAEYVLNIVEPGTHDWKKFIADDELASLVIQSGYTVSAMQGLCYNPFTRTWSKNRDTSINYALIAYKES
ncbi:LOW QUALITY PROTEIN: ubiquinone biosynthesis O-methyltransferase-like [Xenia sp. Carnegie-2017]|uniref:LOW QUALITY PROTEIN: ubiquinone biosynthesis O-methyltransferase-like n=1 Tax=Xenia sp. Carnegie-2017 TaxID=2897299 RepID=UPI001F0340A0|nr:LOW QUALITY PROTEIN: ubiquinone biosynthesis O-methyltransferase-like [Xenia sp. Carnegie-2017]